MEKDFYVKRYRGESFILNPGGNFGSEMKFLDLNCREDINRNLVRLEGSEKEPGKYYLPDKRIWEMAVIPALKIKLKELHQRFDAYAQTRVNEGFQRPQEWSPELADELAKIEAGIEVAREEVEYLEAARQKAPLPIEEQEPIRPRKYWGSGKLLGGVLIRLGGFRVSPDNEGVLRIDDPRSEHDGMPVWRFRNHIWKPMHWQFGFLDAQERKAARAERRPYKEPPYPEAGIWNKETDTIEYPGYNQKTLTKVLKPDQNE